MLNTRTRPITGDDLRAANRALDEDIARMERSAQRRNAVIHRALDEDGWTTPQIAAEIGMHPDQVTAIARAR